MKHLKGFTLIELIIIIAIIAILSAVVLPKYLNLTSRAQSNTIKMMAGTLSSANAENYAARILSSTNGVPITNCRNAANLLAGGLSSGYSITSKKVAVNATVNCTLRGPSSTTATFYATGIR